MTDPINKKSIMKLLGIQELISEYEQHCEKMSQNKKKKSILNRNRYASLLDIDTKKQSNGSKGSIYHSTKQSSNSQTIKNEINQSLHQKSKHVTIESNPNKRNELKVQSFSKQQQRKNVSSLVNFSKKPLNLDQNSSRKTSIKKSQVTALDNANSQISIKPQTKQSGRYPSYLTIKSRLSQKPKQSTRVELDFQTSTLQKINQKIRQFQHRGLKKDQTTNIFRKSHRGNQDHRLKVNETYLNQKINLMRKEKTSNGEIEENNLDEKKYVSIDTSYYGFSFKNKVMVQGGKMEGEVSKEGQKNKREVASTLDKSANEKNTILHQDQRPQRKSEGSLEVKTLQRPHPKAHQTLSTQKQGRYASSNLLKKKPATSSLSMKPKNALLKDRYQLMKVIGRGMSGEVFQAKDILSNRFVAIKQISQQCAEYNFFRQISHSNIIKYYNNFTQNNKRYLILEYFPLTLRDLLKDSRKKIDVTEDDVRHIFKSIVAGLSYLHSLSIAHRDIKLDNIVISEDLQEVKFIDFGLCMDLGTVEDGLSKEFCGTLSYLPPEIIQAQPHQPKKADIWSLGIVLYAIAVGRLPYKGKNQSEILSKICKSKPIYPDGFNPKLKNLIESMLQRNPAKRCTINQIISHQWLQ